MIELKKRNYITGTDKHAVSFGLSKIIDFFETAGWNPILITQPRNYSDNKTTASYILKINQFNFKNFQEFSSIFDDESNLFRVDLIVVDLWNFSLTDILIYQKLLDRVGLTYIIVSDKYHYIEGDKNTMIYKIDKGEYNNKYEYDLIVTEKINNWKSSIDDLIKTYRRDKKIDDLFGGEEN